MLTVRHASFRRMMNIGGETLAEVEVQTGEPHDAELLAYFRSGQHGYQLARVAVNDADTAVDWYDNNLHDAFQDVTAALFSGPAQTAQQDREAFAEAVLSVSGIRQQLDRHFTGGGS